MDEFLNENQDPTLVAKWAPILEHASMPKIEDGYHG
nr:MAG TPA: major capsid protein [Caudoviricetes sp.]